MGVIDFAEIDDFEALSNDGRLIVQVTNIGNVTAAFYVGVMNCTNNIMNVSAQEADLQPQQSKQLTFSIYTQSSDQQMHDCVVYMKDSEGDVVSTKQINFNTTQRSTNSNQDPNNQTTKPNEQIVSQNTTVTDLSCDQLCSSLFDLLCEIENVHCLYLIFP
jgi:hypothetical protein